MKPSRDLLTGIDDFFEERERAGCGSSVSRHNALLLLHFIRKAIRGLLRKGDKGHQQFLQPDAMKGALDLRIV